MESKASAISWADLESVPLKNICSKKCEIPLFIFVSLREPVKTHIPIVTDLTEGICSWTIRSPFGLVCFCINLLPPKMSNYVVIFPMKCRQLPLFTNQLFNSADSIAGIFNLVNDRFQSSGNGRCR